jgi:hypothetical protein
MHYGRRYTGGYQISGILATYGDKQVARVVTMMVPQLVWIPDDGVVACCSSVIGTTSPLVPLATERSFGNSQLTERRGESSITVLRMYS